MTSITCDICAKVFAYKRGLTRHIRNIHKLYPCSSCSVRFNSDKEMRLHSIRAHRRCINCGRAITHNFARHIARCDKKLYREYEYDGSIDIKTTLRDQLYLCPLPIKWIVSRKVNFAKFKLDGAGL